MRVDPRDVASRELRELRERSNDGGVPSSASPHRQRRPPVALARQRPVDVVLDAKSALDAALETGKESLRTGDAKTIRSALEGLNSAYSTAGAAMYQSQQASAETGAPETAGAEQPSGARQDDVVEADYEIVDDKK